MTGPSRRRGNAKPLANYSGSNQLSCPVDIARTSVVPNRSPMPWCASITYERAALQERCGAFSLCLFSSGGGWWENRIVLSVEGRRMRDLTLSVQNRLATFDQSKSNVSPCHEAVNV
jgi:hypothetical protein